MLLAKLNKGDSYELDIDDVKVPIIYEDLSPDFKVATVKIGNGEPCTSDIVVEILTDNFAGETS